MCERKSGIYFLGAIVLAAFWLSQAVRAQSPSEPIGVTPEKVTQDDVQVQQASNRDRGSHSNDRIADHANSSGATLTGGWGPTETAKVSLANLAPFLLPYFNNGSVFGLPGTEEGDLRCRTQLSGDWGGLRTDLARHGLFFDLYSMSAYQDVASGGLKNGSAFIQNTQLSMNLDRGRAGLWSGGIFHVTLESRDGSFSPQDALTVGATAPQ
jgi:porin